MWPGVDISEPVVQAVVSAIDGVHGGTAVQANYDRCTPATTNRDAVLSSGSGESIHM